LRSPRYIIQAHIRKALSFGITGRQVLEALELMFPDAGRIAFENALLAWLDAGADAQSDRSQYEVSPHTSKPTSGHDQKRASAEEKSTMDYQKILAAHDPAIMEIIERVPHEVYHRDRNLDAKTKELITIVAMTTLKAPEYVLQNHVRKALELGATKEEILEALELIIRW